MVKLVHRVRTPAGDDPRFASFESIQANYPSFLEAAHRGMSEIHKEAVVHIMETQEQLLGLDPTCEEALNLRLYQLLWYHVNNYLAWMALKRERHVVRRMCGFKPRPRLSQANPDGVFQLIGELNSDPLKFAMWADATSFIDAGDVLVIDPLSGSHQLMEVKQQGEGIWAFSSQAPKEGIREFQASIAGPANKAEAKTQRLRRQLARMQKIEEVIRKDTGTDPFLNLPVFIADSKLEERNFHEELSALMARARNERYALQMIDECLWVGVFYDHNPKLRLDFAMSAATEFSDGSKAQFQEITERALAETQIYTRMAGHWLALPVFAFEMPDEDVLHLISGIAKVRMYFHWEAWGKLLEKLGGQFRWLSDKEYRSTVERGSIEKPDKFTKGVPYVTFGDNSFVPPSTHMIRIFTDMLRPSVLVELVQHQAQIIASGFDVGAT